MFTPSHIQTFLGFSLHSLDMTVSPTQEKIQKTTSPCSDLPNIVNPTIFMVARVMIGIVISNFPGDELGPFHCRALEHDITSVLAAHAVTMRPPCIFPKGQLRNCSGGYHTYLVLNVTHHMFFQV